MIEAGDDRSLVVRSRIAHLPTHSMRYLEVGSGPAVVLLHAFPLGAEQWLPELVKPWSGQRLIAPDLRGFGGAEPGVAPGGISIDTYAEDVLTLMAHLDVPRARVMGTSMGGYVALAMVRRAPARVTGLVLANTRATADTTAQREGRERLLDLLGRSGPAGVATEMVPRLLGVSTQRRQPDLVFVLERMIGGNSPEGLATAVRAMRDRPDRTDLLASIGCPTVVVSGTEDVIIPPAECEALAREIPGARFVVIDEAGHLPSLEQPAAFAAAVMDTA